MKVESFLPVFPGFYGSLFEYGNEEYDLEYITDQPGQDHLTYDDIEWDYREYENRVAEACVGAIEDALRLDGFDIRIEFQELISPREYNFKNDSINVEYRLSEETYWKLLDYLEENEEAFAKYLENNYKSRSGFISFFEYDTKTWLNEYLDTESTKLKHCFGAVLDFYLENEGYDYNSLYDAVSHETSYIDYKLPEE